MLINTLTCFGLNFWSTWEPICL